MTAASAALLYLDARWMFGALKWDDMATTTAWGLLALLNGPGFRVFRLLGGSFYGLAGIAIFWFSRGLLLDRLVSWSSHYPDAKTPIASRTAQPWFIHLVLGRRCSC
jgi:hypothetical protein